MKKETRRVEVVLVVLITLLLCQITLSVRAEAASTNNNATYVATVYKSGGLAGIPVKKYNNINIAITRWEYSRILKNLYGNKLNMPATWISGETLTQAWACSMLSETSKQLGVAMRWSGGSANAKVNLGSGCKMLVLMVNTSANLKPARWVG